MKRIDSLAFRLTAMVFVLLLLCIVILLFLVNDQMKSHFAQYLQMNNMMMSHMGGHHMMMGGPAESQYISSVHQSLIWVGAVMLVVSIGVSYIIVRKATGPLKNLTAAVQKIREGKFGATVPVEQHDEVGQLAETFNEMSEQLAKNEAMRRQLFANIAHELRTPLAILQGNLEGMIDDVIPADKKLFLSMEDEVLRLNRLVQDLRDLSLAEVNELVLHKEPTDVNELLRRAVSMLQPLSDEKQIVVTLHLDAQIPMLQLDPDRMNQIIYNILNNAIRYIHVGDTIDVTTRVSRETSLVQIFFADSGPGIGPDDLAHVFQYFYRGEKSRNRKSGGSGIGLALAQQYAKCHGGDIKVESQLGKGTTFTVILPME